jgi:hypothetical protein
MIATERFEPRCLVRDGRTYVGVTSAMRLVKHLLGEEPDQYGPPALAKIHAMEGTGCHAACLDYLAHAFGWLPTYEPPTWPAEHGDERRWYNVMHAAQTGFAAFVAQYDVEPIGIEQEAFSTAHGLVGHLDLYCSMKRKSRRVCAVVDLKFVTSLMASHRLQVRCYGRLDGFKDAAIGLLYHANRNTGLWKIEEVDLTTGLEDVAAVANAARLWAWAEERK